MLQIPAVPGELPPTRREQGPAAPALQAGSSSASSLPHVLEKPSSNKKKKLQAVHIGDVKCELDTQEITGKTDIWIPIFSHSPERKSPPQPNMEQ